MPRRRVSVVLALVALAAALSGGPPAGAGAGGINGVPIVLDQETLDDFGVASVDDLLGALPVAPLGHLGLTPVEQQLAGARLVAVSPPNYAFGTSLSDPPVLDAPGARFVAAGSLQIDLDGTVLPPFGMTDDMYFFGQGDLNGPFTVMYFQAEAPSSFAGIAVNEGATLDRPSKPNWDAVAGGDTWDQTDLQPTVTYNPNPFEFTMFSFEPPQSFPPQPDFPGFQFRHDGFLVVGVQTEALTQMDPLEEITFSFHVHWSSAPQSPGTVSRGPQMPVATNAPLRPGTFTSVFTGKGPPDTGTDTGTETGSDTGTDGGRKESDPNGADITDEIAGETADEIAGETGEDGTQEPAGDRGATDTGTTGGGSDFPWWIFILGGAGLIALGLWLHYRQPGATDPCEELRKRMLAAKAACDEATTAAAKARAACKEARRKAKATKGKLAKLRAAWPPAFEDGEGGWVEDGQGNRITSTDLHARRQALGHVWSQYQAGDLRADEVEAEWQRADTPEFREQLRAKTAKKRAERSDLEAQLKKDEAAATTACDAADTADAKATTACDAYQEAKRAYEECIAAAAMAAIADAVGDAQAAAADAADQATTAVEETAPSAPAVMSTPAAPVDLADSRYRGGRRTGIDTAGLSGDELERAEYLNEIFDTHKGTGDIAAVAEALHEFQEWHEGTFGEPWFQWTTDERAETVIKTSAAVGRFMQTRQMACYEFVHFCAYIAGDQPVRQRIGGNDDGDTWLEDEYSIDWGFGDDINTDTSSYSGDSAQRGQVVTGESRFDSWNNDAGYFHTAVYVGDGQVIGLGSDGLLLEDTTGIIDATFHGVGYGSVDIGPYVGQ